MNIELLNDSGHECDEGALIARADFVCRQLNLHPDCDLSIRLVDSDEMTELHVRWMNEPGPTDVLSFPMDELTVPEPGEVAQPGMLGDVVMCVPVAAEQAAAQSRSTSDELGLLLTHGILHLVGHDHAESEERERMFGLQEELIAKFEETR